MQESVLLEIILWLPGAIGDLFISLPLDIEEKGAIVVEAVSDDLLDGVASKVSACPTAGAHITAYTSSASSSSSSSFSSSFSSVDSTLRTSSSSALSSLALVPFFLSFFALTWAMVSKVISSSESVRAVMVELATTHDQSSF